MNTDVSGGYAWTGAGDLRFYEEFGRKEAIVTSRGLSDSGLFQADFRDERYLPFEGAGVESTWSISLPAETNYFDVATVSDVVIHVQYTSVADPGLEAAALAHLRTVLPSEGRLLQEVHREFASEWSRFLSLPGPAPVLQFHLKSVHFPFFAQGKNIAIARIHLLAVSDHLKTYFFERLADRYRRGPIGKGSIHELCRPQTAHRHSVWGWAELGEVISGRP